MGSPGELNNTMDNLSEMSRESRDIEDLDTSGQSKSRDSVLSEPGSPFSPGYVDKRVISYKEFCSDFYSSTPSYDEVRDKAEAN